MAKKLNTYEIKFTHHKKNDKTYVFGAKKRDAILRMMKNNNSYSKVSYKIYLER